MPRPCGLACRELPMFATIQKSNGRNGCEAGPPMHPSLPFVASVAEVSLRYGAKIALDAVSVDIPAGKRIALIGPDGVGKSSLLSLIAGSRRIQTGAVEVLGGDMAESRH